MKLFQTFAIIGISILAVSCGEPVAPIHEKIIEKLIPVEITEADLFSGNKIMSFLKNEEKQIKESNSLFLRGLDAFRNKKKLDSASIYFKESLLKEPTAQTYYELGNLYMSQKKFDDALLSYNMAEQLNYEPFSKILYNKACIFSLLEKEEQSAQYIEYAIQAGYSNFNHIRKDSDLANVRKTWQFEAALKKGLRGVANSENLFWLQFKKQFAHIPLPYDLVESKSYEQLRQEHETISYEYEKYIAEMRDEAFSREVGKIFYYHSIPYETEKYVALIYVIRDDFMHESYPMLYRIATFTHEGKLIDKRIISGQKNMDSPRMRASVERDGLRINTFEVEYEKDTDKHGYYDNPIINETKINATFLTISESGKLVVSENEDLADTQIEEVE